MRVVEPSAAPGASSETTQGASAPRVLVVDDQASIRLIAEEILSASGYAVTVAASAEEALSLTRTGGERYDVLVSDLGLPGTPGDELADLLLAESPDLRLVFMSGSNETVESCGAFEPDAVAFLEKPFPLQDLADAVARVLAGRAETA